MTNLMRKMMRTICIFAVLFSAVIFYGIRAAEENTREEARSAYTGGKHFADENIYDISLSTKCNVSFEKGILNIYAGNRTASAPVSGITVDIDLPFTNVKIKEYRYLAIRIKTSRPSAGGSVTCYAGLDRIPMKVDYTYADTTDWQTVVLDFSSCFELFRGSSVKFSSAVRIMPFAEEQVDSGEIVCIDSFAFFNDAAIAAGFTGCERFPDYEKQRGEWLSDAFIEPDPSYKMMKLLYAFTSKYEETVRELHDGYGYGGITTNVKFNEQYLLDRKEFDLLDDAFFYAGRSGMTQFWIYDEYQWPSGSAYGQVLDGNPEYESIGIGRIRIEGSGSYQYQLKEGFEKIVHAVLESGGSVQPISSADNQIDISVSGDWTLSVYATYKPYVDPGPEAHSWERLRYVNILSKDAMSKFITLTHQRYRDDLDASFPSVTAFFTDEPSIKTSYLLSCYPMTEFLMPWEDSLPDVFFEMHGYSIFDCMQSLFEGDTDRDKSVRVNFYQTVARMVADAYFKQIEAWCSANGVASSGHLLLEEWLCQHVSCYGDLMACLNEMGMPGCDLLQVSPTTMMSTTTYLGSFQAVKFASSAARNHAREGVMVEFNPEAIQNDEFDRDRFGESLGGATLTLLFGADRFVMLNPQETYNAWQARTLNDYVGRVNTILDGAVMNSGIAVYYPIASMQAKLMAGVVREGDVYQLDISFNTLCKGLIENGLDYNYIDEAAIAGATLSNGSLVCGDAAYSILLMPFVESMSLQTMEKLERFEAQGGKIIWINQLPSFATDYENTEKLLQKTKKYEKYVAAYDDSAATLKNIADLVKSCIDYGYTVQRSNNGIYVSPYAKDNRTILFIANSFPSDGKITVSFGKNESFCVYDPYTGGIRSYTGETKLDCPAYRGLLLVSSYAAPVINDEMLLRDAPNSNLLPAVLAAAAGVVAAGSAVFLAVKARRKKKVRISTEKA